MAQYTLQDFGGAGDGQLDNTAAFAKAFKQIQSDGGGELRLTPGVYATGGINLCSNLTLTLEAGATLQFIADPALYPTVASRWEGVARQVHRACVYGDHLHNVTLEGLGTIDGAGAWWWAEFRAKRLELPRPYLLSIENSDNLKIRDLTFTNSPAWTLHPMLSTNILIDGVTVRNPADSPNTDGCDPESCSGLRIVNCQFDVGDDCIAVKAGTEETAEKVACENIVIANCNMLHGHGGVVLGSEMSGNITNVTISNCVFFETDRGIRMKTRRGRGGVISDVTVSNIVMTKTLCPIVINSYYFCGPSGKEKYVWDKTPYPVDERTPQYRHLMFNNILAKEVQSCAAFIYGLPEAPIEDVTLSGVQVYMDAAAKPTTPAMIADAPVVAQAGIWLENTTNARLRDVVVQGAAATFMHQATNPGLVVDGADA